jgi:hypothetical protein
MAADVDAAWYFDGSGVPVGWKERAVGFSVVPLLAAVVSGWIAPGAMIVVAWLIDVIYAGQTGGGESSLAAGR